MSIDRYTILQDDEPFVSELGEWCRDKDVAELEAKLNAITDARVKGGKKSKRTITAEQQQKMQEGGDVIDLIIRWVNGYGYLPMIKLESKETYRGEYQETAELALKKIRDRIAKTAEEYVECEWAVAERRDRKAETVHKTTEQQQKMQEGRGK